MKERTSIAIVVVLLVVIGVVGAYFMWILSEFNLAELDFKSTMLLILTFLPVYLSFLVWFFFGREYVESDYPTEMNSYPKGRKGWEVNTFFNHPFGKMTKEFVPLMLMDFYNKKLVEIKTRKKDTYIKILSHGKELDNIEEAFMRLLIFARDNSEDGGDFISLSTVFGYIHSDREATERLKDIQRLINERSKDYMDLVGNPILLGCLAIGVILSSIFNFILFCVYAVSLIFLMLIMLKSALFIRFNKEYYDEYQHWQAFKRYLSNTDFLKTSPPQGGVVWENFIVYATALGADKCFLDILIKRNLINQGQYDAYYALYEYF